MIDSNVSHPSLAQTPLLNRLLIEVLAKLCHFRQRPRGTQLALSDLIGND